MLPPPVPSDPLYNKTAVILGFARQGQALARWLPTVGAKVIVSDQKNLGDLADSMLDFVSNPAIQFAVGGHPISLLDECDLLCVSGGVPLTLPVIQEAYQRGIRVTNDAQLFIERCRAPVIGITGSAGKTTTTTLIGMMCQMTGKKTYIGGNIGDVLIEKLPDITPLSHVVMELSSFQLELMTTSPQIGCILNVTPNHLDRHETMEAYMSAKSQIFQHQTESDICIFGFDDPAAYELSHHSTARVGYFSLSEMVADGAFMAGSRLMVVGAGSPDGEPHVVCTREQIRLRGEHNLKNVLAACAVAGAAGVPVDVMRDTILGFTGVPHRQELVKVIDGVSYVNDSIATAPERVIAALKSYDEPLILIAGGRDKKLPWDQLAELIVTRVRHLVTFGEFGPQIADIVREKRRGLVTGQLSGIDQVKTLEHAVKKAADIARPGEVVLLSPGGTSYDSYADFAERGEHFRNLVRALGRKDPDKRP
jgi:UDP-N-acetylmuramoylalanine--D-glutamate ligase